MAAAVSTSELRAWAKNNGFQVGDRGRLPAEVRSAWEAAQQRTTVPRQQRSETSSAPAVPAVDVTALIERVEGLEQQMRSLRTQVETLEQRPEQPEDRRRLFAKRR